jgi:SAM-dependent methyltransferase
MHRAREIANASSAHVQDRSPKRRQRIEWLARGLPLPSPALRAKVMRNADAINFLVSGRNHREFIGGLAERNGIELEGSRILDFGCGCGRVLRWFWMEVPAEYYGSDINADLTTWCDRFLPHVSASPNGPLPPTRYEDGFFDFLYSISIFTHLPHDQQQEWLNELARIVRPGGHLMITFAGTAYESELTAEERRRYERGDLVTRFDDQPGSNLCAAYHPRAFVERLAGDLELVEFLPGDPAANMRQDAYLLRRPTAG